MAQNMELYEHLTAARIVYQETENNEDDIIRELKIYLIQSQYSIENTNQTIFNYYQSINLDISLEHIQNINIHPEPIINNMFNIILNNINIHNQNNNNQNNDNNKNNNDDDNQHNNNMINNDMINNDMINNDNIINNDNDDDDIINNDDDIINNDDDIINNNQINDDMINNNNQINNDNMINYQNNNYNIINNYNNINNIINDNNQINNILLNTIIKNINNYNLIINYHAINTTLSDVIVSTNDEDIEKLETITLEETHTDSCVICMSQMVKDEKITLLKCKHCFHSECITPYLKEYNYKCPVCREEVGRTKFNI